MSLRLLKLIGVVSLSLAGLASQAGSDPSFDIVQMERPRILAKAAALLAEAPVTVTSSHCDRSAGGKHDFFSEADYFWPDPASPDGPYIQHDGLSNTNNFVEHRHAMIRLSEIVGIMTSAWILTGDEKYSRRALTHLKAWFVNEESKMNPSLLYAQAIRGRATGRSYGVIDTIHLVEVARSAFLLGRNNALPPADFQAVKSWFRSYLTWLNTHPYGTTERAAANNHAVCWALQAAAFAQLLEDQEQLAAIRQQFRTNFVTVQMSRDGSFPAELRRTKPYGYSLFVLDAMAGVAEMASSPQESLWLYALPDGRGMRAAMDYLYPFMKDKSRWPGKHDIQYWEDWPVRQPCLLLAGVRLDQPEYLKLWGSLPSDPQVPEVIRNLPLRFPLLWVGPMKPAPQVNAAPAR